MSSSPAPPDTFEPLDVRNGVPGDAGDLTTLARRYADTAAEIEAQVLHLAELTRQVRGAWKGEARDAFVAAADGMAERIVLARGRYEAAARALAGFAFRLEDAQTAAYDAVRRAQAAQDTVRTLRATAPDLPRLDATVEQIAARRSHDEALAAAAEDAGSARRAYEAAVEEYHAAAEEAAQVLRRGRDDDLADSWWDRNAGWIDAVLDVLSVVAFVLAIVAVVLVVLATGGAALVPLTYAGLGLSAVLLGGRLALWLSGNGSGEEVLWELAGVLTLGLARPLAAGVRGLSRIASGVASSGAGSAAAGSSRTARALSFGDDATAEAWSAIHRTAREGGGGLQLTALTRLADLAVLGGATAPNSVLTLNSAEGIRAALSSDPEADDRADRARIVDEWSRPLRHAR